MFGGPYSQGTVFQGGNPSPAAGGQRWPRGYSPQRRDEVIGALRNHGDLREDLAGAAGEGWSTQAGETLGRQAHGISAIARSTVPVEHLRGNLRISWGTGAASGPELGAYYPYGQYGTKRDPWAGPDISVHRVPGNEHGPTVIHEIGHHVSATVDKNVHSAYDTPQRRGQEEGYAENYAEKHWRDPKGRPDKNFQTGPEGWAKHEGWQGEEEFTAHFDQERAKRFRGTPMGMPPLWQKPGPRQEELLAKEHSGGADWREKNTYHWDYNEHAPAHLSRQITGRAELERMDQRHAEKDMAMHYGIKAKKGPKFNVFGDVDLNKR
jgi:hypothetical protein